MLPDDIQARLSKLEDEQQIIRNLHAYGHSIDYGREDEWVDCFTEEGVFHVVSHLPHVVRRRIEGRAALATFIAGHTRPPDVWHKHMIVEPLITINGDIAESVCYHFVLMDLDGVPVIRVMGRYLDQLRRCSDGRWRFAVRLVEIESMRTDVPYLVPGTP